jgi:PhzF family phenazine biosynthesis protein
MEINIFKLDAFTQERFSGNPAAVCVLDQWLDAETMQQIASENNLAETAFLVKVEEVYNIRWFTPTVEVDLCGHATLAAAYVIIHYYEKGSDILHFYSERSGPLRVLKGADGLLILDFPTDELRPCEAPPELVRGLKLTPLECYKGKTDYLFVCKSEAEVTAILPDFSEIVKAKCRGVIVTAPGEQCDFVSRFFAPQSGIDEDPVTGSAHTTLTPYWSNKLGKTTLKAAQLSKRKGYLECSLKGDRVHIGGHVVLFLKGEIFI